jgi:hypothetical protein
MKMFQIIQMIEEIMFANGDRAGSLFSFRSDYDPDLCIYEHAGMINGFWLADEEEHDELVITFSAIRIDLEKRSFIDEIITRPYHLDDESLIGNSQPLLGEKWIIKLNINSDHGE